MNMHSFRWIRLTAFSALAAAAITSCASAATDFNQVGKQMSLLLQNFHFSRKEFSDELSGKFLETYLRKVDPNKIFSPSRMWTPSRRNTAGNWTTT